MFLSKFVSSPPLTLFLLSVSPDISDEIWRDLDLGYRYLALDRRMFAHAFVDYSALDAHSTQIHDDTITNRFDNFILFFFRKTTDSTERTVDIKRHWSLKSERCMKYKVKPKKKKRYKQLLLSPLSSLFDLRHFFRIRRKQTQLGIIFWTTGCIKRTSSLSLSLSLSLCKYSNRIEKGKGEKENDETKIKAKGTYVDTVEGKVTRNGATEASWWLPAAISQSDMTIIRIKTCRSAVDFHRETSHYRARKSRGYCPDRVVISPIRIIVLRRRQESASRENNYPPWPIARLARASPSDHHPRERRNVFQQASTRYPGARDEWNFVSLSRTTIVNVYGVCNAWYNLVCNIIYNNNNNNNNNILYYIIIIITIIILIIFYIII